MSKHTSFPSPFPSPGRAAGRSGAIARRGLGVFRRPAAIGVIAGLALVLALSAPVAGQGLRFTRSIEVPAPGWVRVPLAPEILREAAPAGGSLRLFGPEGEEVAFGRVLSEAGGEWLAAEVASETRTANGWRVELRLSSAAAAAADVGSPDAGDGTGASGGARPRHDRLRLAFDGFDPSGTDGAVQVEGSDDGSTWRLLTVGRLDRSAGQHAMDATATVVLAYPSTAARFLRLTLPRFEGAASTSAATEGDGDGAPRIRHAAVETVPARSLGVTVPRPECRSGAAGNDHPEGAEGTEEAKGAEGSGEGEGDDEGQASADQGAVRSIGPRTVCTLPLASAGRHLRRLDLIVTAPGRVGFRLLAPEDGRWEPLAEGVWASPLAETPHSLGLDLDLPRPAEPLRLELYGDGEAPPGLVRADAELAAEALVFRAQRAGRHTLAYGAGVFRGSRSEAVRVPAGVVPRRIEPGPEDEGSVPTATAPLPESAGPAPSVQFTRRWSVVAESPTPGGLYRLPLAAEIYAVARPDLADLRLIAAGAQVPYVRWRPDEPVAVMTVRGAVPSPARGAAGPAADSRASARGPVRVGIDLPTSGLPLSALVVHAVPRGSDLRRRVRVLAVEPPTAGGDGERRVLSPWLDWTCTPRPPLSCRLSIALDDSPELGSRRARRLELELEPRGGARRAGPSGAGSGDGATSTLDLEVWRRQDLLLFPWPSGDGPLRLTAGADALEAPEYDLASRRDELLVRPSRRAEMVAPTPNGSGAGSGWVALWTVGLTLLVALGVLLVLLDRILAEREPSG